MYFEIKNTVAICICRDIAHPYFGIYICIKNMKEQLSHFFGLMKKNRKSALIVAIVNIPLSISLAIASGATPVQWLLSAIRWWLIAAVVASSRHNVFWPAGALTSVLIWATMVMWPAYLSIIAICSGIMLLIIYWLNIIKYVTLIPAAWLQWFLFAVWCVILVSQLAGGLWIDLSIFPETNKIYMTFWHVVQSLSSIHIPSAGIFFGALVALFFMKKKLPQIPGAIIVTVIGIAIWYASSLGYIPSVQLLQDAYPAIQFSFIWAHDRNSYMMLLQDWHIWIEICKVSSIVAIISVLETIISGKVAEKQTKIHFDKQKEILGNGIANIGSGLLGGLPVTAVLVRTSLNVKNGATHKISAGMAAVLTLCIAFFLFTNLFVYIPIPIISAILVFIAISIMDFHVLQIFYERKKVSFWIIITTIIISIFEDTIVWLVIGTIITLLIFLKRVTAGDIKVTIFQNRKFAKKLLLADYIHEQNEKDLVIVKCTGQISYLNTEAYLKQLLSLTSNTIVLSLWQVSDIDIDGLECIDEVIEQRMESNKKIYITGLSKGIYAMFAYSEGIKPLQKKWCVYASTSELLTKLHI
jgi:sulfate permease, SulP family